MASYNVLITQANSRMGVTFVRQLLSLPHPPEYIFAVHTTDENLKDLISIQKGSKRSRIITCEMDLKLPVEDRIPEIKTVIENLIGNRGLDLLINIICLTNDEKSLAAPDEMLKNQFQTSTLPALILLQIMLPLLKTAALRNAECFQERKAVFFNIIEDNCFNPVNEINKVALNLAMTVVADEVKKYNVLVLSTCLKSEQDDEIPITELGKSVTSNLLYAFCSSLITKPSDLDNSTVYRL